ncbi:FKBP-type peptidyl-prolyl cis-trans isomerase [Mucilaginibacter celer]|uniref:peptidylprolyl isomerase n=1 Tax=Mucilaginibacter celer TaxID=2305508 RepID=A0A494VRV7_9SPHI|nr:FKBP-type peptidyl-prolyl cis-trans isomerase [Mucilaginibacter celer]AYL97654.1 FKBP-type peptidylprolyl isomerase [Mucilaginibacter celer]
MNKKLMFVALAAIGFAGCNGGFKQGDGGLLYNIHTSKGGAKLKEGDFMSLNMILKTDKDSIIDNSYDNGTPIFSPMPKSQTKGDIVSGLALLGEGDSATIKVSVDSLRKNGQQVPPTFKGKYLVYVVKIEKVIAKGALNENVFRDRVMQYINGQKDALKTKEPGKIAAYFSKHQDLKFNKTASGLNYAITTPGSGPNVANGDTAVINYTLRLTTGKVLETSEKAVALKEKMPINPMNPYQPLRVAVGEGRVIKGWDEGLLLLNKGAKAVLVVPSVLAYGEQGGQGMQPYTPLVFDVEIVNIVHPNPNAPKPTAPQMPAPLTK